MQLLVVLLHPLLRPLHDLLQVTLQVVRSVAGQLVDDLLTVRLHGLLIDGLEDFTLHVVLQLLPCVTPVSHTDGRKRETHEQDHAHTGRFEHSRLRTHFIGNVRHRVVVVGGA